MAVYSKLIIRPKFASSSTTKEYGSEGVVTQIDKFTATNTSTNVVELLAYLVPSGDSLGTEHKIVSNRQIAPDECYTAVELIGHVLDSGDSIHVRASTANSLVIAASGRVVS